MNRFDNLNDIRYFLDNKLGMDISDEIMEAIEKVNQKKRDEVGDKGYEITDALYSYINDTVKNLQREVENRKREVLYSDINSESEEKLMTGLNRIYTALDKMDRFAEKKLFEIDNLLEKGE